MDLLHNPFHILNATPRDTRHRIMELADEQSLFQGASECRDARATLTHPRNRISAEIAWLPGVPPKRASEMLMLLESSAGNRLSSDKRTPIAQVDWLAALLSRLPCAASYNVADEVLDLLKSPEGHLAGSGALTEVRNFLGIDKLTPITQTNLISARISRLPDYAAVDVAKWILEIARTFEDINAEEVCTTLNKERREAGFPEITDLSTVAEEIQNRRHHYRQIIKSALENLAANERARAVTIAVESATGRSNNRWPTLIEDLVDSYEVGTQQFLEAAEENIQTLNQKLRIAADAESSDVTFTPIVNEFIYAVKNWDTIAQPIQVSKKRQGLRHEASHRLAGRVRQLAIHLFNEYDKLDFSQQLINMLREVFAEVPEIAAQLAEDAKALDKIAEQRLQKNRPVEFVDSY